MFEQLQHQPQKFLEQEFRSPWWCSHATTDVTSSYEGFINLHKWVQTEDKQSDGVTPNQMHES